MLAIALVPEAYKIGLTLQSSLDMEGFRSLREGESVEYVTELAPDGRQKAIKVTGPGGAPPQVIYDSSCSSAVSVALVPGHSRQLENFFV